MNKKEQSRYLINVESALAQLDEYAAQEAERQVVKEDTDFQILLMQKRREREIRNHNFTVSKTVNDLRNAEIFHTGQTEYLQQELAALMAMKY